MAKRFFPCTAGALLLLVTTLSWGQGTTHPPIFVIGSFPFPPLLHSTPHSTFSGTMGETVKQLCKQAGLMCRFRVAPLDRVYKELRLGKIDALITTDLKQFDNCCLRSKWRTPWQAGLFAQADEKTIPDSAEELMGKSLISVTGMRTPAIFIPQLAKWQAENKITYTAARDIPTATRMFVRNRAAYLWGGEDFKWHIHKHDPKMPYRFKPIMKWDVVVWTRKEKHAELAMLDAAYDRMQASGDLADTGLLNDRLMQRHYQDAAFEEGEYGE